MLFGGCQSKSKEISICEKTCPQCGHSVELFSIDSEMRCENCGFVVYNDTLSCVQWCKYAKQCVGEDMYNHMMNMVERRKLQANQEAQEVKA